MRLHHLAVHEDLGARRAHVHRRAAAGQELRLDRDRPVLILQDRLGRLRVHHHAAVQPWRSPARPSPARRRTGTRPRPRSGRASACKTGGRSARRSRRYLSYITRMTPFSTRNVSRVIVAELVVGQLHHPAIEVAAVEDRPASRLRGAVRQSAGRPAASGRASVSSVRSVRLPAAAHRGTGCRARRPASERHRNGQQAILTVFHQIRHATRFGGHYGQAGSHRFQQHEWHAFHQRRQNKNIVLGIKSRHCRASHERFNADRAARCCRKITQHSFPRRSTAGNRQLHRWKKRQQLFESLRERIDAFVIDPRSYK